MTEERLGSSVEAMPPVLNLPLLDLRAELGLTAPVLHLTAAVVDPPAAPIRARAVKPVILDLCGLRRRSSRGWRRDSLVTPFVSVAAVVGTTVMGRASQY